jgi:hypothetical protein
MRIPVERPKVVCSGQYGELLSCEYALGHGWCLVKYARVYSDRLLGSWSPDCTLFTSMFHVVGAMVRIRRV